MSGADTIFALSSGVGPSAVAVVRLSGRDVRLVLEAFCGGVPDARRAVLRTFIDPQDGKALDRGLVLWFPGPDSFTGEDGAEFHLHGGRAVVNALLAALGRIQGLRMAEPGEFTRRAFDNGKLDLTAVEGLADLINAETEAQRRQALRQSGGALQQLYDGWRTQLIDALALSEAGIDFSDEADVRADVQSRVRPLVEALSKEIGDHLHDHRRGEILRDGFQIVLAGAPNAGKSSLLNRLAQRDAAIVSEEAGTTRDVIEVRLDLKGLPVIITDTAGIREAEGAIEKEGIRRTIEAMDRADLVLWLKAPDVSPSTKDERLFQDVVEKQDGQGSKVLSVLNKCDLREMVGCSDDDKDLGVDLKLSAKTGEGVDQLIDRLAQLADSRIGFREDPAISNARQRLELEACYQSLQAYFSGDWEEVEMRAEDLRAAAFSLGRLTGRVDVEDVLDKVFSTFCIGK